MMRIITTFAILLLTAICINSPAQTHSTSNAYASPAERTEQILYLKVDYLKTTGEQTGTYLEVEQKYWKPVHQERYRRGIINSWDFYHVVAGEPDTPYNFVVINVFDDFGKIDYYELGEIISSVYPDKDPDMFMKQTRASREVVRTEIWQVDAIIMDSRQQRPGGNYLTINFFDSRGGSGEHADLEFGFWGRIHETRVDRNILNSWAMYSLLYPGGDARHYTYCTIDYYDELSDLREPVGLQLARIAHPGISDDEYNENIKRTIESRSLYKTELWKRIDSISVEGAQN